MLCPSILPPTNLQPQSPFLRLPAEIQHIICGYAFTAKDPIVDPRTHTSSARLDSEAHPPLGTALLQTCRRLYHEIDRRPLFAQNVFRFTTAERMRSFVKQPDTACNILDVEIDFQRLDSDQPEIAREWLRVFNSLGTEIPNLKCLRLNFDSWPKIPMFRIGLWMFLQALLLRVEKLGLERIIVTGASKGRSMARRVPWSPVHFVGGDDVGLNNLVPRMKAVVAGPDDAKIIRWIRNNGKLQLEVVSLRHLRQCVDTRWNGPSQRQCAGDPWPASGSCTPSQYQDQFSTAPGEKLSPSVAE